MPMITCNNVQLHYERSGSGPEVLLLHGNSSDLQFFDALTKKLEDRYTVYRMDSRCHGKSEKAKAIDYTIMMEDTAAFIQALGLSRPALIGSSDGGITGLLLTIYHPNLVSCHIPCGANTTVRGLKRWFYWMFKLAAMKSRAPVFRMVVEQPDISASDLASIVTPTLIMAGTRDIMTNEHSKEIADSIPGAALCLMQGQTHTSYLKNPEIFLQYANDFLDTHLN